ncbi:MAG: hypothetical protein ACK4NB_07270, partial [Fimbriimonadales bacterium]
MTPLEKFQDLLRVMNPKYLALPEQTSASVALQQVRQSPLDAEYLEVVFVLGEGRLYRGYVTVAKLLKAAPDTPLCELVEGEPIAVSVYDSV